MKRAFRFFIWIIVLAVASAAYLGYMWFTPNNALQKKKIIYIAPNDTYNTLLDKIDPSTTFSWPLVFEKTADYMNLPHHVYPGKYIIDPNQSMISVIRQFRSGSSEPVKIVLRPTMKRTALVEYLSEKLWLDKTEFNRLMNQPPDGYNRDNIWSIFIADTYFFNWATNADEVVKRMIKEKKAFFKDKTLPQGLSPAQVNVLATIVQGEAMHTDEMNTIAGLYLNRLRIKMPLQADPTVKFALGLDSIQRVTKADLEVESPYNTYKYAGLPPGPIKFPSKPAIKAVLKAQKHSFIYMCAKEDFSGYHRFSTSYNQHLVNARKYQRALNARRIYR